MKNYHFKSKIISFLQTNWPLLLILGLAVFLRFYQLGDLLHFANDEARDAFIVKDMIERDFWRLTGPPTTIGNFDLGPFFYYFLLPFYLVFNLQPVAGGFAVALLDLFTISLIYFFARKYFSRLAAVLAALLYVTSFWVNLYERWGWNPNVLPFFTVLALWLCVGVFSRRDRSCGAMKYVIGLAVTTGLAVQAHAQGFWLLVFVLLFFVISKRAIIIRKASLWRNLKLGVLFLATYLVVNLSSLIFEFKTGGQNSRAIINWVFSVRESVSVADKIRQGVGDFIEFTSRLVLTDEAALPVLILFLLPSLYFTWRYRCQLKNICWQSRRPDLLAPRAILLFTGLILFSFCLIAEKKYFHFFLGLAPAIFIYLGFLLARLYRLRGWWSRVLVLSIVVFLISANLLNIFTYWCNLNAGTQTGEFDLPLQDSRAAVSYIVANSCAEARVKGIGVADEQQAFAYLFDRAGRDLIWVEDGDDYQFVVTRDLMGEGERFGRIEVRGEE